MRIEKHSVRIRLCKLFLVGYILLQTSFLQAQGPLPAEQAGSTFNTAAPSVVGKWTYRSFLSNPDLAAQPNDLLFGRGTLELLVTNDDLTGTLGGPGWELQLTGKVYTGNPTKIRFTGRGVIGGEEWVYDYLGYVIPKWTNSVDQRPAIVGTIVRTKAHSGGAATAGVVAQWIAVSQDGVSTAPLGQSSVSNREMLQESVPLNPLSPRKLLPSTRQLRQSYLDEYPLEAPAPTIDTLNKSSLFELRGRRPADEIAESIGCKGAVELKSSGGRLDVTLNVEYGTARIGNDDVNLRMYNGCLVGPTLRLNAGDTLYITLNNRLPVEASTGHDINGHHEWNTTNLHFHGLHVEPQGPTPDEESDNVLISIPPSNPFNPTVSTKKYKVEIPNNHVAGTFWYHAHRHGATTAQVSSGMAGALIVERTDTSHNLDSVTEISACQQHVMVLQQIPYLKPTPSLPGSIERSPATSPDPDANDVAMFSPGSFRNLRRYTTVNGLKIPEFTLQPGEIRRLRLVHSGQRDGMRLRVERAPATTSGPQFLSLHEIAVDGLPTGGIRETNPTQPQPRDKALELYPGYRSDVLLQAPEGPGVFYLVDTQNDTPAGPRTDTGRDGSPEMVRWIAKFKVEGAPKVMALPTESSLMAHRLPDLSLPPSSPGTQYAFYGLELGLNPIGFFVSRADLSTSNTAVNVSNAKPYDPSNARILELGATERWYVGSRNNGAAVTHPFHIHINPFLITKVTSLVESGNAGTPVDVTSREIGAPTWRDTLAMKHGYTYELLTRYEDFAGDFVNHCHILDHEDNGMMELVRIRKPSPVLPVPFSNLNRTSISKVDSPVIPLDLQAGRSDRTSVLFFVKGSFCPHCMAQLVEMSQVLKDQSVDVTVVSASNEKDLELFPGLPFRLVPDPEGKLFRRYGAFDAEPKHATIVSRAGRELFRNVSDEPLRDVNVVLNALRRQTLQVVVDVRTTPETTDDYITWAPTECLARIVGGDPAGPDVSVVVTNDDSTLESSAGNLRFASTSSPGSTASNDTITLSLPQSGAVRRFFIAGAKASELTAASLALAGRDAVMEFHQDTSSGPLLGSHAVMVRVRRNASKLNALERAEYIDGLATVKGTGMHEQFVLMHRIATGREFGATWSDQAHGNAGFLPWHRAFLLHYERELQKTHPHMALHYWREDEPSNVFEKTFLGANSPAGSPEVDFGALADGNPLHGWSISGVNLMRNARDRSDLRGFALQNTVLVPKEYRSTTANFSRGVESNPHNFGHGWVGGWMASCQTSPQDPVFFLFHTDIDRLWAQWQWEHDKFKVDGSDPKHYRPNDNFVPGSSVPLGHHLFDTMWPWDQVQGPGLPLPEINDDRPNSAPLSPFPASTLQGVWPATPSKPQAATMIDYLGVSGSGIDMGFCYDDAPFGVKPSSPTPVAQPSLLLALQDRSLPLKSRIQAATAIVEGAKPEDEQALLRTFSDTSELPELRLATLDAMRRTNKMQWIANSIATLEKRGVEQDPFRLGIVRQLESELFSGKHDHGSDQVHESLRRLTVSEESKELRAAAAQVLASHQDSQTIHRLREDIRTGNESLLHKAGAIGLLAISAPGQNHDVFRPLLARTELESVRVSALLSLGTDSQSSPARQQIALDRSESQAVRDAALRSLLSGDASLPNITQRLVLDEKENLSTRLAGVQTLRLYVTQNQTKLSIDSISKIADFLSKLQTNDEKLKKTAAQAASAITRVLDRK